MITTTVTIAITATITTAFTTFYFALHLSNVLIAIIFFFDPFS